MDELTKENTEEFVDTNEDLLLNDTLEMTVETHKGEVELPQTKFKPKKIKEEPQDEIELSGLPVFSTTPALLSVKVALMVVLDVKELKIVLKVRFEEEHSVWLKEEHRQCAIKYDTVSDVVSARSCSEVFDKDCQTVTDRECKTEVDKVCEAGSRKECHTEYSITRKTVQNRQCGKVDEQICSRVPQ